MAQQDDTDKTVGLVKALAWPFIALIGIFLFAGPIKNLLLGGNLESVKIGSLELNLRASDLPQVSDRELASALMGLPEAGLVPLLFTEPDSPYTMCQGDSDSDDFDEETRLPFIDLSARGLVIIEEVADSESVCLTPVLTDLGVRARTFIVNLISAQLKTAKVQ